MKNYIKDKIREALSNNIVLDKVLDKINQYGIKSLTPLEKQWLDKHSKGHKDSDSEDLLSIDSGYSFKKQISHGELIIFTYEETEDYENEIIHKGNVQFGGNEYSGEIYCNENGKFIYFTVANDDYIEFNPETEYELEKFFKEVSDKIQKTL